MQTVKASELKVGDIVYQSGQRLRVDTLEAGYMYATDLDIPYQRMGFALREEIPWTRESV